MSKSKKIGWQKYEDLLDEQINNNFLLKNIQNHFTSMMASESEDEIEYEDIEDQEENNNMIFPLSQKLFEDMAMLANYDCWIGHTNFDITEDIKNTLDTVDGIEILKICSRYRFFIGIGKMFNFKQVRINIEKELL